MCLINFVVIYGLLLLFLFGYTKRIEKPMEEVLTTKKGEHFLGKKVDYYLDSKWKKAVTAFGNGVVGVLPGVLLILMANSIRFTMMEGKILDVLLTGTNCP